MGRLKSCAWTGKKTYGSEESAISTLIRIKSSTLSMKVYKCSSCRNYHLATINKKKREKPDESIPD